MRGMIVPKANTYTKPHILHPATSVVHRRILYQSSKRPNAHSRSIDSLARPSPSIATGNAAFFLAASSSSSDGLTGFLPVGGFSGAIAAATLFSFAPLANPAA
jgi:hypothetical protein